MVINDEEDAAYNLGLANKTDTVDEIIVVMGTGGVAARYDEGALLQVDGIAWQGRAAAYHHLSQGIVDGHQIAFTDRLPAEPSVTEESVVARTQTIRPTVYHHTVARLEGRLPRVVGDGVDGKDQRPEHEHDDERDGERKQKLQAIFHLIHLSQAPLAL